MKKMFILLYMGLLLNTSNAEYRTITTPLDNAELFKVQKGLTGKITLNEKINGSNYTIFNIQESPNSILVGAETYISLICDNKSCTDTFVNGSDKLNSEFKVVISEHEVLSIIKLDLGFHINN